MGYQWSVCYQKLTDGGMVPCDGSSSPYHCQSFEETEAYHKSCGGQAMYQPVQAILCRNSKTGEIKVFPTDELITDCNNLNKQDPNWQFYQCYCCCSCLADGTLIDIPDGQEQIQNIDVGSEVLAGSVQVQDNKPNLTWGPARVKFSDGTQSGNQPAMVYLVYGDKQELIVSPDQVFMLSDGKLTTANKIKPGDELVDKSGNPVAIYTASLGNYKGGVHHIATDLHFTGDVNNHLIVSAGVVAGDYTLQLYFEGVDDKFKVHDHKKRPQIGTDEYQKTYTDLKHTDGKHITSTKDNALEDISLKKFSVYKTGIGEVPYGAQALFTPAQAHDIMINGTQFPLNATIGLGGAQYLQKLFSGFYPEINFFLEWDRFDPNIYAFEEYGQKTVLISGGLVRMKDFSYQGLAMAIAHGIARFYGGVPENSEGYACTGNADFYAFGVISRKIWYGDQFITQVMPAYQQISALCGFISPANAKGNPLDVCGEPSIECRLSAMQSGVGGGSLPSCAGGPEKPLIALQSAEATINTVKLTFSLGLTKATAEFVDNYAISPEQKVLSATLDEDKDFVVHLNTANIEEGKEYTIEVNNLMSVYNTPLDPQKSSLNFTVT